jgi:hypothetical protein
MAYFSLSIDGGWSTDAGPAAPFIAKGTGPAGETIVSVPWLVEAQNVVYSLDGWPRKMPGASKVNAAATGATDAVKGLFDYWRGNTSGPPTQQRLVWSGTQLYRESGGTLTSIKSGLEADEMPWFAVMNDECVIASTSIVDVPMVYDQTAVAPLGGSPPNFAFHVEHRGRMFAAGVESAKYRLYYSAAFNHEDWTGAGSGSIDLPAPIAGIRSHLGRLVIFLGPNHPAVYYLTGSSPTGDDAFALVPFVHGVGAENQQATVLGPGSDLWFWDHAGLHSLHATERFGDYAPEFLSFPIAEYFLHEINHEGCPQVWGVNFASRGYALWTVPSAGSTTNDHILMLDYRFRPYRFAKWPAFNAASLAMVQDSSHQTIPWCGTYTGHVLRMHQATRNLAGLDYTGLVRMPYLAFGDPFLDKTLQTGRVSFLPKGESTFDVRWQRDGNAQQSVAIQQGGEDTLAPSNDQFILDVSTLGGGRFVPAFFDMQGIFKEIQFEMAQGGLDQDFEPHSMAIEIEGAGMATRVPEG